MLDGDQVIVVSTYAPNDKSEFLLSGIDEGTYRLKFEPPTPEGGSDDPVYQSMTIENVLVTTGQVTDIGTVVLELQE